MTLLVHIVGEGDLGSDILRDKELRQQTRESGVDALRRAAAAVADGREGAVEHALNLLLQGTVAGEARSRFKWTPLALELAAIANEGEQGRVDLLMLGTDSGCWPTRDIAEALTSLLAHDEVRTVLRENYGLDVHPELHAEGNLSEQVGRGDLRKWVEAAYGTDTGRPVVVSMIGGSTTISLSAMGVADQLGYDWNLAVAKSPDDAEARLIRRGHHGSAPFYWLRALGYLEQAAQWARQHGREELIDEEHTRSLRDLQAVLGGAGQERGEASAAATDEQFASLVAVEMARADNGAGLAVRAWVEKHYEALLAKENQARAEADQMCSVFDRWPDMELGKVLRKVRDQHLDEESTSAAWLLDTGARLNNVGKTAVHNAAAPTSTDLETIGQVRDLWDRVPSWMHWPGRGRVLYICGIGAGYRPPSVIERVMEAGPDQELRRAVPGGMLEGGGVGAVDFLLLHSVDPESAAAALRTRDTAAKTEGGVAVADVTVKNYGGAKADEFMPVDALAEDVADVVRETLDAKAPSAVAIVGSGPKGVTLGALTAAQAWCAEHAVPLFVETSVQPGQNIKRSGMQFHRIALHNDAEAALREAAAASLSSLNLLSAVRVLSAGDQDMDLLAEKCDALRRQYVEAAQAQELDEHAGVIIDVLKTASRLIRAATGRASENRDVMRLVVAAAEISHCGERNLKKAGTSLLHEGPGRLARRQGSDPLLELKDLTRGELLRLLYEVRNRLAFTHGGGVVADAVRQACAAFRVGGVQSVDALILRLVEVLAKDADTLLCDGGNTVRSAGLVTRLDLTSNWAEWFTELEDAIAGRRLTDHEDSPRTLVNLTPHEVILHLEGGPLRLPGADVVPRLLLSDGRQETLNVYDPEHPGEATGAREVPIAVGATWLGIDPPLPASQPGTVYVTSRVVAEHFPQRTDLVWPDDLIRDADGQVVGARRLGCLPRPVDAAAVGGGDAGSHWDEEGR